MLHKSHAHTGSTYSMLEASTHTHSPRLTHLHHIWESLSSHATWAGRANVTSNLLPQCPRHQSFDR